MSIRLSRIVEVLRQHRFKFSCEKDLQDGIEEVLRSSSGFTFERESRLSESDLVDFMVKGIALEVKIQGSLSSVTRQLMRYADQETVTAILLVTTKMQHKNMPPTMRGKPVRVVYLPAF